MDDSPDIKWKCLIKERIHRNGNKIAVVFDDGRTKSCLTYSEVWIRAEQILTLLKTTGIKDRVIGVSLESTINIPSILIGVWNCDCSFLPFSTSDGTVFINHSFSSLKVPYLIIDSNKLQFLADIICENHGEVIRSDILDQYGLVFIALYENHVSNHLDQSDLAYCITTSGSTGTPKIVQVPFKCILPNIQFLCKKFQVSSEDMLFLASPLTFDPSMVDLMMTLLAGASILIVPDCVKMMPSLLLELISCRNHITILQATPALLHQFQPVELKKKLLKKDSRLRVLALGGEEFPPLAIVNDWIEPGCFVRLFNLYGITEVSCWSHLYQITEEDLRSERCRVPLGEPIDQTEAKVTDHYGNTVLEGEGQLCIGSKERRCYVDNEVTDHNESAWRLTGDIVKICSDSSIIYLGRSDSQIKRHGKRVDLSTIEKNVTNLSQIKQCCVVYDEEKLVLFYTLKTNDKDVPSLQSIITDCLKRQLPTHYQPDYIKQLQTFPLTKHGKIDKVKLRRYAKEDEVESSIPTSVCELLTWLKTAWKTYLRCEIKDINNDSNFIQLGGDSLQAVHLTNYLETSLCGKYPQLPNRDGKYPQLLDCLLNRTFSHLLNCILNIQNSGNDEILNNGKPNLNTENIQNSDNEILNKSEPDTEVPDKSSAGNISHDTSDLKINSTFDRSKYEECDNVNKQTFSKMENTEKRKFLNVDSEVLNPIGKSIQTCTKILKKNVPLSFKFCVCRGNKTFSCDQKTCVQKEEINLASNHTSSQLDFRTKNDNICKYTSCDNLNKHTKIILNGEFGKIMNISLLWKHDTGKCVDSSPCVGIDGNGMVVVFIGSHSHKFCAVDVANGELLWEITLPDRIESSPCLSKSGLYIVVGCYDGYLYVVDVNDGSILWKFKTGSHVKSSPTVDEDTWLIIFGSHDQCLYALDVESKELKWKCELMCGSIFSSPAIYKQVVYIGTLGGILVAVQVKTGKEIWRYNIKKPIFSSPCIIPTTRYIIITAVDGVVYAISLSGHKMWTFQTSGPIFSSPVCVHHHHSNCILIGSHDNNLYCLNDQGQPIWTFKASSHIYSTPFVFNFGSFNTVTSVTSQTVTLKNHSEQPTITLKNHWEQPKQFCECLNILNTKTTEINNGTSAHEPIKLNGSVYSNGRLCDSHQARSCTCPGRVNSGNNTVIDGVCSFSCPGRVSLGNNIVINSACPGKVSCSNNTVKVSELSTGQVSSRNNQHLPNCVQSKSTVFIVCMSTDGNLNIIDLDNGKVKVSYKLDGEVFSSPVVVGNRLIVGCRDNNIYCFKLS